MGVQILNKDVSIISSIAGKAKATIGNVGGATIPPAANPFLPGDFNFIDGTTDYTTNTVTFTKSGKLYIYGTVGGSADWAGYCVKNGTNVLFYNSAASAITYEQTGTGDGLFLYLANYGVVSVNIGDTMYFNFTAGSPMGDTGTVEIRINSFSGTIIDTINMTKTGCYLTSATVQFKGLLDDGPELTAMRALREHYISDTYYSALIDEYYESSIPIIKGIDASVDPSIDYEYIYQSVLRVKDFVDSEQWTDAWDEYYSTYLTLKAKYRQ